MSSLIVEVVTIDNVLKHENADRLDVCVIKGWNVITGRNKPTTPLFKPGDQCIYIPIDSILPEKLEAFLFPVGSKITLQKSRVRTIKIRGAISQGMIVALSPDLLALYPELKGTKIGDDVAQTLGITKFEPPVHSVPSYMKGKVVRKNNPDFHKFTDIQNYKHFPNLFWGDEDVYITEKLHGTNARYALLKPLHLSLWQKVQKLFHKLPEYTFHYGSHNIELQTGKGKVYYDENVYARIAKEYELQSKLLPGEILYGEIVGDGIQKGYTYGCGAGQLKFFAFDVKKGGRYLDALEFLTWCAIRKVPCVPILHMGFLKDVKLQELVKGDSLVGGQKVREGIVIKPTQESTTYMGRKVLKLVSDEYLLKEDQTDFH